jgi:catechol 2,3-dioxygenase-like lactoylglutathione lyase family enzyme
MTRATMLDHANFTVANLDESIDWYGRLFGYEVVERGVQENVEWCIMLVGEAMICMYEHPKREFIDRFEAGKRGLHYVSHIGIRIDDRKAWEATIEGERVELLYGGEVQMPHGTSWYLSDPTGWEIEVALWDNNRPDFTSVSDS